jgi:DNA (cytosine-5)-methyltransferase 1
MRHGSLFSGIGGFDLAAQWMGWENVFHCEWNPFGQKVLHHYWPNAEQFTDITKSDFKKYHGTIDIISGGFPCQPYSMAGKRLGKEDDRHLWPEMLRVIREVQPTWVVGENVFGLVNWSGGLVFHEVQSDLEAEGYEVQPYVLPAVSVNAPHRRDRVWFVAYSHSNGSNKRNSQHEKHTSEGRINALSDVEQGNGNGNASNTECSRLEHGNETRNLSSKKRETSKERCESSNEFKTNGNGECYASNTDSMRLERCIQTRINDQQRWNIQSGGQTLQHLHKIGRGIQFENFPTVSPICNGDDGLSHRLDSITFPKWRAESIKAGGNAIVPQVAYQIFKSIQDYERLH